MKIYQNLIAIIGDLHIGIKKNSPKWLEISLDYAKWLKQELIKKGIKDLVILGDIVNNRNEIHVTTMDCLSDFFDILEDFNIIIILGNHDCFYNNSTEINSMSLLKKWDNISVIDNVTSIAFDNKILSFCAWNSDVKLVHEETDYIFGHFEIKSYKMTTNNVCENGLQSEDLFGKKQRTIFSGHFHLKDWRKYPNNYNSEIIYTGSAYELNWGDYDSPKGVYFLDINENKIDFFENTCSPKHKNFLLTEVLDGKIQECQVKNNIINVEINVELEPNVLGYELNKIKVLQPTELKQEYKNTTKNIVVDKENIVLENVDMKDDLISFIKSIENLEYKNEITEYLINVYNEANNSIEN